MHDLAGRFVVVWDGGPMHRGDPIQRLTDHFADRLCLEALPPWAPMLHPTEPLWGWLKYDRLCNYAPQDAGAFTVSRCPAWRGVHRLVSHCDGAPRRYW